MATVKTLLTFVLLGAFLGLAGASWLGPKYLEWDNTPRYQSSQTICDVPALVRDISAQMLEYQLIGTLIGAGVFLLLGIFFVVDRTKRRKQQAQGEQPPATPSSP